MNNNKPKLTHPQQQNLKKLPQLQLLNLKQLDGVAGGAGLDDPPPPDD